MCSRKCLYLERRRSVLIPRILDKTTYRIIRVCIQHPFPQEARIEITALTRDPKRLAGLVPLAFPSSIRPLATNHTRNPALSDRARRTRSTPPLITMRMERVLSQLRVVASQHQIHHHPGPPGRRYVQVRSNIVHRVTNFASIFPITKDMYNHPFARVRSRDPPDHRRWRQEHQHPPN